MVIRFSRHAKRRAKITKYQKQRLRILTTLKLIDGEYEFIRDISGFKYPIKIVVAVENDIMTVITNYPLKKGRIK